MALGADGGDDEGIDSEMTAKALTAGVTAVARAMVFFTASPPNTTAGIETLAKNLLISVHSLLPDVVQESGSEEQFQETWMSSFISLPAAVQSIRDDIAAFEEEGSIDNLLRAMNTIMLEASSVITKFLPEQTANYVDRFIGSIVDLVDGIGDGLEAFEQGDAVASVELIYRGVKAAADDLVPEDFKNDDTYRTMVEVLDGSIGSLSKHVLEFRKRVLESNVCWRGYADRPRQRPAVCDEGYTFDGEQWCIYRGVSPYTIQSRTSGRYMNVKGGSKQDGANVIVWNNPDSLHSQWNLRRKPDGNYTIENVHAQTFLYAEGAQLGANVALTDFPQAAAAWRLVSLGVPSMYNIQNVASGLYLNLEGGSTSNGANVALWSNAEHADCMWRIRSAWGGAPFELDEAGGAALLDASLRGKRPSGALPSRCNMANGFSEKRGSWCYGPCPQGYEIADSRCKVVCRGQFPAESPLVCAANPGALAVAISQMVTETFRQVLNVASMVQKMTEEGVAVAGGLVGTMEALIETGKSFAHPMCPV